MTAARHWRLAIVQCAVLCLMAYFIPIAIWGGLLLYWRFQRAKTGG